MHDIGGGEDPGMYLMQCGCIGIPHWHLTSLSNALQRSIAPFDSIADL